MKTLIMKFGGTSVGSVEALQQTSEIIKTSLTEWEHIVVVVSAMSGVTNLLLDCAHTAVAAKKSENQTLIQEIRNRHLKVIDHLFPGGEERQELESKIDGLLEELQKICYSIAVLGEITPRGLATVSSLGERMNVYVVSAILRNIGVPSQAVEATELVVTDARFDDAAPDMHATKKKTRSTLHPLLKKKITPVVTGFIGATEDGKITTLGRGGSDFTAAILGSVLDSEEVWTWTDVDGVMTADPRVVKNASVIPELSFAEVGEMAYFGAKVLHPKTILPIIEQDIPLWVKNTFNPTFPGTRISRSTDTKAGKITAVSVIRDLSMITVAGRGMLGVPGIAARTFSAVARESASVLMISQSSSEQSICFIIPTKHSPRVLNSLEEEFDRELNRKDIDKVAAMDDVSILTVIGDGMRETPGVSAKIFGALGKHDINVIAIAQGSSEYSISLVVSDAEVNEAMCCIHDEVIDLNGSD
ncbi:MAG: aspartate kinase [Anaerolineales bacterium]|nr:aspartate kinase [Anaerolineales bacterium]